MGNINTHKKFLFGKNETVFCVILTHNNYYKKNYIPLTNVST